MVLPLSHSPVSPRHDDTLARDDEGVRPGVSDEEGSDG